MPEAFLDWVHPIPLTLCPAQECALREVMAGEHAFLSTRNRFGEVAGRNRLTGDAAVNRDAPIMCCTAEILANVVLLEGDRADL